MTENGDLFGEAVQMAAHLCARSRLGTILISTPVYDLVLDHHSSFGVARM